MTCVVVKCLKRIRKDKLFCYEHWMAIGESKRYWIVECYIIGGKAIRDEQSLPMTEEEKKRMGTAF